MLFRLVLLAKLDSIVYIGGPASSGEEKHFFYGTWACLTSFFIHESQIGLAVQSSMDDQKAGRNLILLCPYVTLRRYVNSGRKYNLNLFENVTFLVHFAV